MIPTKIDFESIELRQVKNGVIVVLRSETDEDLEYVFDNARKAMKFIRELLEGKPPTIKS